MNKTVIYIHGLGGSASEAEHYAPLFPSCKVTGFDYRAQTPWQARDEFPAFARKTSADGSPLILIANSIGAYFAMQSLRGSGAYRKSRFHLACNRYGGADTRHDEARRDKRK